MRERTEEGDEVLRDYIEKQRQGIVFGGIDYPAVTNEIMRLDPNVYAYHLANACYELLGEKRP